MHGPPVASDENGVPRAPEGALCNLHPGLVADSFQVSFDIHTRYTGVTETTHLSSVTQDTIVFGNLECNIGIFVVHVNVHV